MNTKPLLDFLVDEGHGTPGIDLFRDFLPSDIERGVVILSMTPTPINPYHTARTGEFQIVGRDTDSDRLLEKMEGVSNAFTNRSGLTLGNMKFHFIKPEHEPLMFPKTEADVQEASVSFAFSYIQQT